MRGRPRKSVADLKLHGNFREDRHGDREEFESEFGGLPEKPEGMDSDEEQHWDYIVSAYGEAGPITAIDGPALLACCQNWALWQRALKAYKNDIGDKDLRIAVTSHYKDWDRAAAKLGLNPRDRRSIAPNAGKKPKTGVKRRERA